MLGLIGNTGINWKKIGIVAISNDSNKLIRENASKQAAKLRAIIYWILQKYQVQRLATTEYESKKMGNIRKVVRRGIILLKSEYLYHYAIDIFWQYLIQQGEY